ncbi:MAG: hypothetical protein ACM3MD_11405 [Betaproteobacteria bacterium]
MTMTGKQTRFGMESWFLVSKEKLQRFIPHEVSLYSKLGMGTLVIGVWNHANAYVDDVSYGPVLEAWIAIGVQYRGQLYGYMYKTYNNNPSYAKPVNDIFKFTKEHADIHWEERNGRQELEVRTDEKLILRFIGRPTFIPKSIPFSKPRLSWLIKDSEYYVAELNIAAQKSRLAFTSIYIPENSPMEDFAKLLKGNIKFSVFYENTSIKIPMPKKV